MRATLTTILLLLTLGFAAPATAAPDAAEDHGRVAPHHVADGDHAGYDDHGDYGEEPSVFAGTIAQSIAAILVFLTLLTILHKYAWGPILTGLQDRESKIRADLHEAQRNREEAERALAGYKQQLADARAESQKIIEQSRGEAEKVAATIKADADREITVMKQRAQQDIAAAKEEAISDLYARAATLATDVAGRILQREIRPEDQQALVNESLAELNKPSSN